MGEPISVVVRFDAGVAPEAQGVAMFELEKRLRGLTGKDVRVFKDLMGDDSKLRRIMTPAQREKL